MAHKDKVANVPLLDSVTSTGTSEAHHVFGSEKTFHAWGATSSGSGAAVIQIEGSNDNNRVEWKTLGTFNLTLSTTSVNCGLSNDKPWKFIRANVLSISGTDATVSVILSNIA